MSILAMVASVSGCASSQDVRILDREITQLQSQVTTLQEENQNRNREMVALRNEWKSDQSAEAKKLQTDLQLQLESLKSDVRILDRAG